MATFDAVGPSSAGASATNAASLSYTHTVGGGVTSGAVTLGVNTDASVDSGLTTTATFAGSAMTSMGRVETTSGAGSGYMQGFKIGPGVATGASTVAVTVTGGTASFIVAGSDSVAGVTGFGTPVTKNTDSSPNIAVAGVAATSIVVGYIATGATVSAISTGTSDWINNAGGASTPNATGDAAGGHNTGTGTVTVAWTASAVSMALIAVEVQGAGGSPSPWMPQRTKNRLNRRHRRQQAQPRVASPVTEGWGVPL